MWNDNQMYGGYGAPNRGWGQQMQRQPGYGYAQQPTGNLQWIYVNGAQEARDVSVAPGGFAWIMERERPFFYFKRANDMGQTMMDAFRFESVSMDEASGNAGKNSAQYATKEDIAELRQHIEQLQKFANDLGGVTA